MTKHDNADKNLAGAKRSGYLVDPKESKPTEETKIHDEVWAEDKAPNYDEAMESFPFNLVSPSTKSKADTSQDTLADTSESKNKPLHECDDMDQSRTEKQRNDDTSKKKRQGCCICMGCFPCCGGEEEE